MSKYHLSVHNIVMSTELFDSYMYFLLFFRLDKKISTETYAKLQYRAGVIFSFGFITIQVDIYPYQKNLPLWSKPFLHQLYFSSQSSQILMYLVLPSPHSQDYLYINNIFIMLLLFLMSELYNPATFPVFHTIHFHNSLKFSFKMLSIFFLKICSQTKQNWHQIIFN